MLHEQQIKQTMKKLFIFLLCHFAVSTIAQSVVKIPPAGLATIQENDVRKDLFEHADARFKGRGAGTINELNGAVLV